MAKELHFTYSWSGSKYTFSLEFESSRMIDLKAMIYSQTLVLPGRQKLIGLQKGGSAQNGRDEDLLCEVLPNTNAGKPYKFIMMGTREEDLLKEPSDMDLDDSVVNDLDIDYSISSKSAFTPWNDLENLKSLQKITRETKINIINDIRPGKKLIVFDLDYTLFDCKSQVSHIDLLARPGLHDMLAVLYKHYEFVIWSQTSWRWLEAKITELGMLQHPEYKIAFVLDIKSMFSIMGQKKGKQRKHQVKPLKLIWDKFEGNFGAHNTIHIDDLGRNFALNPASGLKIAPFKNAPVSRETDRELVHLTKYLLQLSLVDDFTSMDHSTWKSYQVNDTLSPNKTLNVLQKPRHMGAGDLNLKKSWHPSTFRNQAKVWEREQKAEAETRKIEQMKKELQEERDREELYKLHNQGKNRGSNKERLEWMYSAGPAQTQDFIDQEKEDYLLGKRKIDVTTFKGKAGQELEDDAAKLRGGNVGASSASMYGLAANTTKDFASKVREDPLLAFKRQEQATLEAMMKNPIAVKRIKEKDHKKKSKKSKRSSRSRSRSRSRSPKRDRQSFRDYDERRDSRDRRDTVDRRDSRDTVDRRDDSRRDSRDRDYYKGERREPDRYSKQREDRDEYRTSRRRSPSPRRRSPSPKRDEAAEKKAKLEAMLRNAKNVNESRAERVSKDRQEDARDEKVEKTDASSFSAMLNRSVYEKGTASDLIQRKRGFALD